ncbi:hypothetical protein FQA39_LY15134 [Lamprigera yunnana]|nr:hypothetical protein FQA39_LY15134 [Lamprigera yunnana]
MKTSRVICNEPSGNKASRDIVKRFTSRSHSSNLSSTTTPIKSSRGADNRKLTSSNLMTQFDTKRKQFDILKEDLNVKKQLVSESYKVLVELKKKLDQSGTDVILEELNCDDRKVCLEPETIENMKNSLNEVPEPFMKLCQRLMDVRKGFIDKVDSFLKDRTRNNEFNKVLKAYKEDTAILEKEISDTYQNRIEFINQLMHKWSLLSTSAGDASNVLQKIGELQDQLKEVESELEKAKTKSSEAVQKNKTYEKRITNLDSTINQLKDKIKSLENDLATEKISTQTHLDKFSVNDKKVKELKGHVKQLEIKYKDSENKCTELQKSCKSAQDQATASEQRWLKEKEDLTSKNKHDRQMLDKLTKDRSCFQTRTRSVNRRTEENVETESETLEETRRVLAQETVRRQTLQQQYEHVYNQLVQMEIKHRQSADLIQTRTSSESKEADNNNVEREAELYTELQATRVGLKAAEDRLQCYHREKLRFLDTIQQLRGDNPNESLATIENIQKLIELEETLNEKDEIIYKQKLEISHLNAEVAELKSRDVPLLEENDIDDIGEGAELKLMLHEGKGKLEDFIQKSSENEQKAITYKHDLDKQSKQLCEMENLLKAREGLLSLIKAKKDELQLENTSLNRYANEVRELLIQSREEARTRNELVQELTISLNTKDRALEQLEKVIKELENSLCITNEKRFKLQDTISAMEKELQSTNVHTVTDQLKSEAAKRYGIVNSSKNCKSPKNRFSFTYTQNQRPFDKQITDSNSHKFGSNTNFFKLKDITPSNTSSSSENSSLDSGAIRSWLNSYENVHDIQKRLKFLKSAFNSLSKRIILQDLKLKQSALETTNAKLTGSRRSWPLSKTPPLSFIEPNSQQAWYPNFPNSCKFFSPTTESKEMFRKTKTPSSNESQSSSSSFELNVTDMFNMSSSAPKFRFFSSTLSNTTIPSTVHMPPAPINRQTSEVSISKEVITEKSNFDFLQNSMNCGVQGSTLLTKPIFEVNLDKRDDATAYYETSRSSMLYTNSNISTLQNTQKQLQQMKTLTKTTCQHETNLYSLQYSLSNCSLNNNSYEHNHIKKRPPTFPHLKSYNVPFDTSTDSLDSHISIPAIIRCSELINKVRDYNDLLIGKNEYVLKLFSANHSDSDNAKIGDFAVQNETDTKYFAHTVSRPNFDTDSEF